MQKKGKLFYVIGASGAGKDSVMQYARNRLNASGDVIFAHRYITRSADSGGENHVALSSEEFDNRLKSGCFALHWESHGIRYGIGIEIDLWMQKDIRVVVNGSRAYVTEARKRYADINVVLIEVSPEILEQRLRLRGRESEDQIRKRLDRHRNIEKPADKDTIVISNDGSLAVAGNRLVELLTGSAR